MERLLLAHGYLLGRTIGEGRYAKVKEAFSQKHRKKVAIKIIDKKEAPEGFIRRFLPRELHIITHLEHRNIIHVYEVLESAEGKVCIVMELAKDGDLFEYLEQKGPLRERRARALFLQLVEAIRYCHRRGVVHRDLKCENTLLQGRTLKLADFGFSKVLPWEQGELSRTFCGSTAYMAPEVLQGLPHDSRKADVWSAGVILYALLCACLPFDNTDIPRMLRQQQKGVSVPAHLGISKEGQNLLKMLLEPDVRMRPSIEAVRRHPWLKKPLRGTRSPLPK